MKCTKIALATLFAGMMVTAASADSALYEQDFDEIADGTKATAIVDENSTWESGSNDESVVTNATSVGIAAAQGRVLQINTEGDVLTNRLDEAVTISSEADIYMDAMIQFVPSDDLATIAADDSLKLALYALQHDDAQNATLVVYHSVMNGDGDIIPLSTDTGFPVSTNGLQHVVVTLKQFSGTYDVAAPFAFQVKVNNAVVTSTNAYTDAALQENYNGTYYKGAEGETEGSWFLTANSNSSVDANKSTIKSLAFSGTGYLDDLAIMGVEPVVETYVAQIGSVGYTTLTNAIANAAAGDTVVFLTNIVEDATISIAKNLTLDLNGYYLSNTVVRAGEDLARVLTASAGNVVLTNGTIYGRVNCYDAANLTIAADTTVEGFVLVWGDGTYGEAGCLTPTLNVAGTVNAAGEGAIAIYNGASDTSKPAINILDGAVVNADWGVILNDAVFTMSGGTINAASRGVDAQKGSSVTISGGAINATDSGIGLWEGSSLSMTGGDVVAGDYGVFNNGSQTTYSTTMAISGGTITSTNTVNTGCGIYQAGPGALTISGTAVVSGPDAVEVRAGTVQVLDNARLVATASYADPASNGNGNSGHGGVALLVSQHTTAQAITATVSGGTLTGAVAFAEVTLESQNDASLISGAINGGVLYGSVVSEDIADVIPGTSTAKFSDANAEGVAEGYELVEDPQNPGLYIVQPIPVYAITVTVTEGKIGTNGVYIASGTVLSLLAGDQVVFTANADTTLSSVTTNGAAVAEIDTNATSYTYTVGSADATVAVVFASAASDDYKPGDTIGAETLNADMAAWLNAKKGAATREAFEKTLDDDGLTLADEYLLNTDPTKETTVDFAISAIAVGTGANLSVSLTRTENSAALDTAINGQIVIESCDTPNGTFSGSTAVADGAATVAIGSGDTKKFYRAKVIAK